MYLVKRTGLFIFAAAMICALISIVSPKTTYAETADGVAIDETNFPDENFREFLLNNYLIEEATYTYDENLSMDISLYTSPVIKIDSDENGILSSGELDAVKYLYISEQNIGDLTGIEYFTNLKYLDVSYNNLKSLDVSKNVNLEWLDCSENDSSGQWDAIKMGKNSNLKYLNCSDCKLSSLNLTNIPNLEWLVCYCCNLKSLNLTDESELVYLDCRDNNITDIDVSGLEKLKYLRIDSCKLKNLDVSNCTELTDLECYSNNLTSLNVSKNCRLIRLNCSWNSLSKLDVSNNTLLEDLRCTSNKLNNLNVSQNTKLTYLDCTENNLTTLDVSKNINLTYLSCATNKITNLDISQNIELTYCDFTYLEKQKITATASYSKPYSTKSFYLNAHLDSSLKLNYTSSNKSVVTVSSTGKVTMKGVGKAVITLSASGNYQYIYAEKKITVTVKPGNNKISYVKNLSGKKMKISFTKSAKAAGYQIQYSLYSSFKKAKTITVSGYTTTSKTISNLIKGKKYYVRVRGYKKVSGTTFYGAWSAKKSIKISK